MGNYNSFVKELANTTAVDASVNYALGDELYNTAAIAADAIWTAASVTGTITPQASIDGTNWHTLQTATDLAGATSLLFQDADVAYKYFRFAIVISDGQLDTLKINFAGKG